MDKPQPINWTIEQKKAVVEEFLQEYKQTNCYTTTFARKRGINDSTFLGWVRLYDTGNIYPNGKLGRSMKPSEAGSLVLVAKPQARQRCGLSIEYEGCSIQLGSNWTSEDLARVLAAVKGAGR
ncbi:MAG: hypothetical protein PHO72_12405 [Sphaerochaeta sp.]|nr:hypothetical protein [Sphaerochaeta sp.]